MQIMKCDTIPEKDEDKVVDTVVTDTNKESRVAIIDLEK